MLDKFEMGRNYRFSKEMCLEDISGSFPEELVDEMLKGWVGEIDGLEITFNSHYNGEVMGYSVSPEWCEEITDGVDR